MESLGWEPVVWFAPAEALPEMRRWLGDTIALYPRPSGDMGSTLATIARQADPDGGWLAVRPAGSGLTVELLERAQRAVDDGGLVFGATTREDVYLLGGPCAWADFVKELPWANPTSHRRFARDSATWARDGPSCRGSSRLPTRMTFGRRDS